MQIILLGTGTSIPIPEKVHSGLLVKTLNNLFLFDCGSGVLHRIAQSGYDHLTINHVFFTHHHIDHNGDFLSLLKANYLRGNNELKVFGPKGTNEWLLNLFNAYQYLKGKFNLTIRELENKDKVILENDIIDCRKTKHSLLNLAYKITSFKTSVVYSGDSEPCDEMAELCKNGVEILIHECSFPDEASVPDHSSPSKLGELIKDLPIKMLVLTHLYPEASKRKNEIVQTISKYFKGKIIVARDLLKIEV